MGVRDKCARYGIFRKLMILNGVFYHMKEIQN